MLNPISYIGPFLVAKPQEGARSTSEIMFATDNPPLVLSNFNHQNDGEVEHWIPSDSKKYRSPYADTLRDLLNSREAGAVSVSPAGLSADLISFVRDYEKEINDLKIDREVTVDFGLVLEYD